MINTPKQEMPGKIPADLPENLKKRGLLLEITQDGSPTLRLPDSGESMHHSGGAAAETIYIYGSILDQAHQILRDSCKTCVVGLGLGYIEIAWALSLLKNKLSPSPHFSFHSFEIIPELIENFEVWIHNENSLGVYDWVTQKLNPAQDVTSVKTVLQKALLNGSGLNGEIQSSDRHQKYNVIAYDAFSQKTNEDLWQAQYLDRFLTDFTEEDCILTTYACTGVLRKALIAHGFTFYKRPGFCGKRDSTLAVRGIFKSRVGPNLGQISSYNQ